MYKEKNPYYLSRIFQMHERCSHCDTKYKMEPSFFYGAMYVSYGLGITFAVAVFLISFLLLNTSLMASFLWIVVTLVIFMPIIIRLSRNIWINLFVNYDSKAIKE